MKNKNVKQKNFYLFENFLSNPLKQILLVIKTGVIIYAKKTENK